MKNVHVGKLVALLGASLLMASACTTDSSKNPVAVDSSARPGDCITGAINVSGSSTVEPISRRAAELYEDTCAETYVNVDGPGTGDGFKLFCNGETDVSNASRQIKDSEAEDCEAAGVEFVELRVAFDGIAIMTNPNNSLECLSFVDLYALLGGQSEGFDKWSDADDLATSLGSTVAPFPEGDLALSAPGTESGTYDSFIEIVLEGIGEEEEGEDGVFIRRDFAGNSDDNVIVEGIAGSNTSLGWAGFAYASENADAVKSLAISEEPGGDCVVPSTETIADGTYPVSRSLYIYVSSKANNTLAVTNYIDYYLGDAYSESVSKAFGESGYVELPPDLLAETVAAWESFKK